MPHLCHPEIRKHGDAVRDGLERSAGEQRAPRIRLESHGEAVGVVIRENIALGIFHRHAHRRADRLVHRHIRRLLQEDQCARHAGRAGDRGRR